ncbi:kinase with adenine nucleotide alpha hydrolases-like domain-containing protein [Actinidia rufa]|uniref:Kinase with adenine nucleotide alpha hydrolases-like domain-containing protein n=1 Tax=Actinidia rufa TaxID=165716 RepID=A0A7J0FP41_9ERIC|nr:kinase with adenine nucleotide alpha hydrolases-like domain-containing protein [Actinidia rufa]
MFSLRTRTAKKMTIIVGLKSDNLSRQVLLRLLTSAVVSGDSVLAVHVLEPNDSFDPNTFHIHEDLCKSKQVEFQVKVCGGDCYVGELAHQVRINFATILVVGCRLPRPKNSTVANFLKALPPTCSLIVMDNGGRILMQRQGTSQEGSPIKVLKSSLSLVSKSNSYKQLGTSHQIKKSLTMPSSSKSTPLQQTENFTRNSPRKALQLPISITHKLFQRLSILEIKGCGRRFTSEELSHATSNFNPEMMIGEGGNSKVYQATLEDGFSVAVKVLKNTDSSAEDLFREVETLSNLKHENVVALIGYCYDSKGMYAIVYNLLEGSLKQKLKQLRWSERMRIAIGVGKALEYIHSLSPPIIHRDVKSSNILLSDNCQPQLSDFGAAIVHQQNQQLSTRPFRVVGTFGYLAPEYMMYGKVDEKIDVYSYGVVLLELITGKEAIQTNQASNHESLVLWARSLLNCGLCERLIDPTLNEDYNKDEMKTMMIAARLCLLHSSSRRPAMKTILQLFEQPEQWLEMQQRREELLNGISSKGKTGLFRHYSSDSNETLSTTDDS